MSAARPDDFFIWFPDVDFLPPEGFSALPADDSAGKQVSFGVVTLVHVQYIHPICHQVPHRFCLLMCDDWWMAVFDEILVSLPVVYPSDKREPCFCIGSLLQHIPFINGIFQNVLYHPVLPLFCTPDCWNAFLVQCLCYHIHSHAV